MKLDDILDPEELRIMKWAKHNLPNRSFSPNEEIYNRIKRDERYSELFEFEKETIFPKIELFVESQTIDLNDNDSTLIINLVTDAMSQINQEFENMCD